MNKIFNWVFGSFFRTIGRLLVFVLLGFIIAHFIDFGDIISNFRITDLFFEKVNAESFANGVEVQYYQEEALTNRWSSNNWYDYATLQSSTSIQGFNQVDFYPNPQINIQDIKKGYIEFTYYMSLPIVSTNTQSTITGQDYCDRWTWGTIDSYNNVIRWDCARVDQTDQSTITDYEYVHPVVNINAVIIYNNGYADYCSMDTANQKFICPISNYASLSSIKFIRFSQNVYYSSTRQHTYYFGIMRRVNKYSDSANAIIENQNQNTQQQMQQQQQQHNEMMNDTVQDTNETQSMFSSFESFLPENGIITQLITLPILLYTNILNNVNGSCSSFSLGSIYGEPLTLPCINISQYLGSNLWGVIDILMSGFFVLVIARKLIKVFQNMSSMKEGDVIGD